MTIYSSHGDLTVVLVLHIYVL